MLHLLNISVHNIRQATRPQAYYRIQTDGRTDLNFNFEPVSPVSHSVKFSWFLSEFIVLKVEIEDRNLVLALLRKIPGSAGKNIDFRFNYTPKCMVSCMNFQKFSGEGLTQPPTQSSPSLNIGLRPRFSGASRPRSVWASPSIHPSNMFINPSPNRGGLPKQRGTRPNTVPQPQLLVFPNTGPKISFHEYVVRLKYTIEKIIDSRLGELLKNPPTQRHGRVIPKHTARGIIAPDASILVQTAPKSLAAGAPPQTPLGELTALPRPPSCYGLGWRFGNNSCGGQFCAQLLMTGAPLLF